MNDLHSLSRGGKNSELRAWIEPVFVERADSTEVLLYHIYKTFFMSQPEFVVTQHPQAFDHNMVALPCVKL